MQDESEPTTPEAAFAAFRQLGDGRALAVAFDATAPELLRVAAFLVPRDDVEDLVHDTFAVALAKRAQWDANRPLLPWLLGILANEARAARRRARLRHREREARAPIAVPDPAAVARARETEAAFQAALEQLDRSSAALLRWHLVDDLSCREIAARERRPAGTVRTQVARAMADLRRRLPVGLAVAPAFGVGFGVVEPARLERLRGRVLAQANAPAAAAAVWWLRPRSWLVLAGCGAAAAVATELPIVTGAPGQPPPDPAVAAGTAEPARAPLADVGGDAAPAPASARALAEAAPPPRWLLRGRVTGDGGRPLADARVCSRLREGGRVLAETRSAADGGYELDLSFWRDRPPLDRSGHALVALAGAPGHDERVHLADLPAREVEGPLVLEHDFILAAYPTLRGRAIDRLGRPVPAKVLAQGLEADAPLLATDTADADGEFRLVCDAAARVRLDLRDPVAGRQRVEVDVPAAGERDLGDVTLQPGHRIGGSVRLADGTPLPGFTVDVRGGLRREGGLPVVTPDYWYHAAVTDAAGRFVANRGVLHAWTARLEGPLAFPDEVLQRRVPSERDEVEFALDGVRLDLSWADAEGRPLLPHTTRVVVWAAGDRAAAEAARGGDAQALRAARADTSVRQRRVVVPCGSHVWLQACGAERFAAEELLTAPLQSGVLPLALAFAPVPSTRLRVRVRFADGGVPAAFTCRVVPRDGASAHAWQELERGPGEVTGRCAIGPVVVEVAAYPERFDGVVERREVTTVAGRTGELDVVLARRGRIRFVLRDAGDPARATDYGLEGGVRVDDQRLGGFVSQGDADDVSYWGSPPLGRPVEPRRMLPVGSHAVRFAFDGFAATNVTFDVTEGEAGTRDVWLQRQ